jgi:hypothetical protein
MPIDTRPVSTSTTVTDPTGIEPCPYCGDTSGVEPMPAPPKVVDAWTCTVCRTDWAISVVGNPHLRPAYLVDLVAAVAEINRLCWTLVQVITLADQPPPGGRPVCGQRLVSPP